MKLGTETGSLINHIYGSQEEGTYREVGMGVTILHWTDREAGTIVKVTPKTIHVTEDKATRIDKNGMSESQEYTYETNPNAKPDIFRLTKRGWRNSAGNGLLIGIRRKYYDYSF